MKRFLLGLLLLASLTSLAVAAEKNTALIHPGDTVYVRFETQGKRSNSSALPRKRMIPPK